MKRIYCLATALATVALACLWPEIRAAVGLQSPTVLVTVSDFTLEYTPDSRTVTLSPHTGAAVKTGTSDSDGNVAFVNVTPGLWTLRIAAVGLPDYTLQIPNSSGTLNATNLIISAWTPPAAVPYVNTNLAELSKRLSISEDTLLLDGSPITSGGSGIWITNEFGYAQLDFPDGEKNLSVAGTNNADSGTVQITANPSTAIVSLTSGKSVGDDLPSVLAMTAYDTDTNRIVSLAMKQASHYWVLLDPQMDYAKAAPLILGSQIVRGPTEALVLFQNDETNAVTITGAGAITLAGTTNQVTFGGTNTAPVSDVAPAKWISVQVSGRTNAYRIPLYE